jgi:crotonobetaine/carnitine-CoA ligase
MTDATWTRDAETWTLRTLLERRLELDADGEYLDVCGTKLTAADVSQRGNRVANALIELGVQPGDRVATLVEHSAEAVVTWWDTILAGAISVPVNTAYKGEYLRHQLHDAGAKVLVVESSLADRAAQISDKLDQLFHVILIGEPNVDIPNRS